MGAEPGVERVVGGERKRDFGWVRRIFDWHGDFGVDRFAFDALRGYGI